MEVNNYAVDIIALKQIMVANGIETKIALSRASGVDRNTLGKILSGKIRPSSDAMDKIAGALSMSPELAGRVFLPATYVIRKLYL